MFLFHHFKGKHSNYHPSFLLLYFIGSDNFIECHAVTINYKIYNFSKFKISDMKLFLAINVTLIGNFFFHLETYKMYYQCFLKFSHIFYIDFRKFKFN